MSRSILSAGVQSTSFRPLHSLVLISFFVTVAPGVASAANYTVANYAELRQQSCSTGDTAEIASGRFAGNFDCVQSSNAWRTPFSDDGGIQFSSGTSGNIWKRSFSYSQNNPIQLEWYESVQSGARVDLLVEALSRDFRPNVYIRSPNVAGTYNWPNDIDATGTKQFYFTESAAKVVYEKQTVGPGTGNISFLRNDGGDVVYVGGNNLNMTFRGPAYAGEPQAKPGNGSTGRPGTEDALTFYACGGGTMASVTVKVNVRRPLGGSVGISNSGCGSGAWQNVELGGVYEAAFRANDGFQNVHLDNVVAQDPLGRRWGWTGSSSGSNNSGAAYKVGGTARVQKGGKLTGELTLQYGIKMFWAKMNQVGNSVSDPFVIHYRDNCYSGPNTPSPGTRMSTSGINGNISKMDDLGTTGRYWYSLDQEGDTYGNGCGNTFFDFESSKNGGAANSGVTLMSSGLTPGGPTIIDTAICQGGDRDDNHTIMGGPLPNKGEVRMVDTVTLTKGTFQDVLITGDTCSGKGDNTLRDVTLTGQVNVSSGMPGTTLDNVRWTGSPRRVLNIGSGSPVTVTGRLSAPPGSTIDGSGSLSCGGSSQNLPFTFDGVDDACETTSASTTDPPVITVTSPNGGESWQSGSSHAITWSDNISENVRIELVQGTSVSQIVASTPSDGSYNWTIPAQQAEASNYRVRITSTADAGVSDNSNANFSIQAPAPQSSITVTSPNGGESWLAGSSHAITWSDNISENVRIELVQGSAVSQIVASTASDGSYNWTIPAQQAEASNYRVRITSTADAGVSDNSNANFSIQAPAPQPSITVTSPNGGESWQAGTSHAITWSDNISENVRIELVQGSSVSQIVASTASDGSYNWTIPAQQAEASNYRIRVTSTADAGVSDDSNANFSIASLPPPPPIDQDVALGSGWNLMSLNVEPADPSVENVVGPISDDMILLKDNLGRLYYPELGINTIGSWDIHEGYQINVVQPVTLVVGGQASIDPLMPIDLEAGWNLIPYPLTANQQVESALASIIDHVVIVINNFGDVYYPQLSIDEIGTLKSGRGYRIYVDQPVTLVFGAPG